MNLEQVQLSPLSPLGPEPVLGEQVYEARLTALRTRLTQAGLDAVLVYADREHYANASYLTGFDPRFEEALVLVTGYGDPAVLAGNESLSFCEQAGIAVRGILCQSFSLPSQDRSIQCRITEALAEAGLDPKAKVGVVGWKPVPREDAPEGPYALAVPQYVLSEIEAYVQNQVVDATLLLGGMEGLRAVSEADQLALNEHRATRASQSVWRALEALRPGATEFEVAAAMQLTGLPLACHIMCTSGADSVNGLSSPSDRQVGIGDRFSTAVGFWGGLCCRAGLVVEAADARVQEFVERFAAPYYAAVRTWYENVAIGVTGGEVSAAVRTVLDPTAVRPLLDAGHLISLDEWFDSPFMPGGKTKLVSGTALQCDIIPTSESYPGDAANVEDSLALAGEELRAELADRFPELWARVSERRRFMSKTLRLELAKEVLPFSDRQGLFAPALLSLDQALVP